MCEAKIWIFLLFFSLFRDQETGGGDCLQYDTEIVANLVMRLTAGLSIVPLLVDVALAYSVRDLNLYLEPMDFEEKKSEKQHLNHHPNMAETSF